jgi:hypothetical protein
MKKLITVSSIISIILIVILFTVGIEVFEKAQDTINDVSEKYESKLGNNIMINNKTYVITDYSLMDETFILDNGSTIKYSLVEKMENPY